MAHPTYICEKLKPDGSMCGQIHYVNDMYDHNQWHKREERREKAKRPKEYVPTVKVEDLTIAKVAYDVEMAQLYMDRGLMSALDRVATDLTKATGETWGRKRLLQFLAGN